MTSTTTVHPYDTLRPGDRVTLTRTWPAGSDGPGSPARTFVATLTIRTLHRLPDRFNHPQWYLEGVEPETAGCWAVGQELTGMTTTLARVELPACAGCLAEPGEDCDPFCLSHES